MSYIDYSIQSLAICDSSIYAYIKKMIIFIHFIIVCSIKDH